MTKPENNPLIRLCEEARENGAFVYDPPEIETTTLYPKDSLFAREIVELEKKQEQNIYDAFNIPEEYMKKLEEDRETLGGIGTFMSPVGSTTATEEAINEMSRRIDAQRYAYLQTYKEEDNMGEEMWGLYQVVVVEKSEVGLVEPTIDMKVIAKNKEHAAGLSGYNDLIEKYNYDNTKVKINIQWLMDIKPVEDDE